MSTDSSTRVVGNDGAISVFRRVRQYTQETIAPSNKASASRINTSTGDTFGPLANGSFRKSGILTSLAAPLEQAPLGRLERVAQVLQLVQVRIPTRPPLADTSKFFSHSAQNVRRLP